MHEPAHPPALPPRNRYGRTEWAGAFGDLGTLVPFLVAYLGTLRMDPSGVLASFGLCMVASGLYYKTPMPVQPMKAIGAAAAAQAVQTAVVTPAAVTSAALVTGLAWLFLGLSGLAGRIARLVPPSVVLGIVLGLGLGLMLEGARMMQTNWPVAAIAGAGGLALMHNQRLPAMLVLLAFGIAVGCWQSPELLHALRQTPAALRLPSFALSALDLDQFLVGAVLLALPQLPLTLGNAVIAIRDENNRLFPQRPATETGMAVSTGIMNVVSAVLGGVPMCHGAGGMAGHVAFGARTGGALVILGLLLLALAAFFSTGAALLFKLLPLSILGVILFLAGAQLALGAGTLPRAGEQRAIVLMTAALCIWNVAAGFLLGLALHLLARRGLLRL